MPKKKGNEKRKKIFFWGGWVFLVNELMKKIIYLISFLMVILGVLPPKIMRMAYF